jgi:hypothetical protein
VGRGEDCEQQQRAVFATPRWASGDSPGESGAA